MSFANNFDYLLLPGPGLGAGNAVVNLTEGPPLSRGLHFTTRRLRQGNKQTKTVTNRGKHVSQRSLKSCDLIGRPWLVI